MANMATVVTPSSRAKGVSSSKRFVTISWSAPSGTPPRMAPKATPSSSASASDVVAKAASQALRQRGPGRCERNSSVTARRMSTTRTSMKAA